MGKHAFMPKPYMDWRQKNVPLIQRQLLAFSHVVFPITDACLFQLSIYNDLRSDVDNVQAGVMDLLQDAGVIEHDRPTIANQFDVLFFKEKKAKARVLVTILPAVPRLHDHDLYFYHFPA